MALVAAGGGCAGSSSPAPTHPITQGTCPADSVCWNIFTAMPGPVAPSRLLLAWVSPDEKGGTDVVELAQLGGREQSVVVKRSQIRPPSRPGSMGVSWGYVYAVPRDASKSSPKDAMGIAQMMFSDALPEVVARFPAGKNSIYPNGLAPGIGTYRMNNQGQGHDKFFLAGPGTVFDFVVCPLTVPNCQLPAPNPN